MVIGETSLISLIDLGQNPMLVGFGKSGTESGICSQHFHGAESEADPGPVFATKVLPFIPRAR
jgi:hypothetical protein